MNDSSKPFLDALLANPKDLEIRSVYSDYLSESGDPAGNYLRLEIELFGLDRESDEAKSKREELAKVMSLVDVKWLRRIQQPDLMLVNPTRFTPIWLSSGLCDDVEIDGTYGRFHYSDIANVANENFDGSFSWLVATAEGIRPDEAANQTARMLTELEANARAKQVALPLDFFHFLSYDPNIIKIPSVTDCYFGFETDLIRAPGDEGWFLAFYSDSQDCCHWYLYLDDFGGSSICWAFDYYSAEEANEDGQDAEPEISYPDHVHFCAPDFETFACRLWCENTIWLNQFWRESSRWEKPKLDSAREDYLGHYQNNKVVEIAWPRSDEDTKATE